MWKLVRLLTRRRAEVVPRAWLHCPICDAELQGPWHAGTLRYGPMSLGRRSIAPSNAELVAKCPTHGHLPFNDPDKKPPWQRVAK
jgi:hypothetical protein